MLKRQSLKTGLPLDELRDIYSAIPRAHREEVLDRRALKETSVQCTRKVRNACVYSTLAVDNA